MANANKQSVIVRDIVRAKGLGDMDPDDLTLWALLHVQAQISEALTGVYLHRNVDRKLASAVMMIRRAGRICHAIRRDMQPQRGSVEFVETQTDEELGEAFAWLMMSAPGRSRKGKTLQFLAARYARLLLRDTLARERPKDLDLTPELDPTWDEIAAEEAVSDDDAIEDFLRSLEARSLDADRLPDDPDDALFDEGDLGGDLGDGDVDDGIGDGDDG